MATIDIRREHDMTQEQARQQVETLAEELAEKFDVAIRWEDDVLAFQRTGVHGEIAVNDQAVQVLANLSLMLRPLKGTFESHINHYLDEHFA